MDDIKTNIRSRSYMQYEKNRAWQKFDNARTNLAHDLMTLSAKSEEDLTKQDLLKLIQLNCAYMQAYSLYNYWKEELEKYQESQK